jgi:hypothetical protein
MAEVVHQVAMEELQRPDQGIQANKEVMAAMAVTVAMVLT